MRSLRYLLQVAQGVAKQLDQVGKATVGIGRAQTRMGQASASAGRAFAAQASWTSVV